MCITQERVSEGRAKTVCVLEYKKHTGWLSRGCITAYFFPHPLLLCQLYEVCVCVCVLETSHGWVSQHILLENVLNCVGFLDFTIKTVGRVLQDYFFRKPLAQKSGFLSSGRML
jgi:hypothetical protein